MKAGDASPAVLSSFFAPSGGALTGKKTQRSSRESPRQIEEKSPDGLATKWGRRSSSGVIKIAAKSDRNNINKPPLLQVSSDAVFSRARAITAIIPHNLSSRRPCIFSVP